MAEKVIILKESDVAKLRLVLNYVDRILSLTNPVEEQGSLEIEKQCTNISEIIKKILS